MASSLLLLKPELVAHPVLMRAALQSISTAGIEVKAAGWMRLDRDGASRLYHVHKGKFFYTRLVRHVSSGPVLAMEVVGDVRAVLGSSKLWPLGDAPTLRQKLSLSDVRNVAHNSDAEAAQSELSLIRELGEMRAESIEGLIREVDQRLPAEKEQ